MHSSKSSLNLLRKIQKIGEMIALKKSVSNPINPCAILRRIFISFI
jgi:hypothetical protein